MQKEVRAVLPRFSCARPKQPFPRVAQHNEVLLQKPMVFSDSAFPRNISHLLLVISSDPSPLLPSPFPGAHHHASTRLFSTKSHCPLPSTIADLISRAPLAPPPKTAANSFLFSSHLPFWCFASPAVPWIYIPPFSCYLQFLHPLQEDFREPGLLHAAPSLDHMSLGDLCPPLHLSISLSPSLIRTAIAGMFYPTWDVSLCFILHTAPPWAPP